MRLIFMYHAINQGGGEIDLNKKATNQYALGVKEEGYFHLIARMLQEGIVDEILLIIESTRGVGVIKYAENFEGWVIPDINKLDIHLRDDDVIWCRGGHRSNHDFLKRAGDRGHWLMLYAANTGRQRWNFWDVVLDDLTSNTKARTDRHGRLWIPWAKPINTTVFFPIKTERIYDICIGASHIHDKKGQWRVIKALSEYGKRFKCVMPGAIRRGVNSNNIPKWIEDYNLDVTFPRRHLPRKELNMVLNQSKVFVHAGTSGQGDRGPLEAMRCGCNLVIGAPSYHSPHVINAPHTMIPLNIDRHLGSAILLMADNYTEDTRDAQRHHHTNTHNMLMVQLPFMNRLFSVFRQYPKKNKEALLKEYEI